MSRRHGRTHHHERGHHGAPRPGTPAGPRPARPTDAAQGHVAPPPVAAEVIVPAQPTAAAVPVEPAAVPVEPAAPETPAPAASPAVPTDRTAGETAAPINAAPMTEAHPVPGGPHPADASPGRPMGQNGHGAQNGVGAQNAQNGQNGAERASPCTAPQLRRFIKSRPYVPMHELRRRFAIDGGDDDVSRIQLDPGYIFVGLPAREGQLLGELLRAGEIGYELSLDPRTPIVVGVYPMRPVPRP
jgi:hypothetical protein